MAHLLLRCWQERLQQTYYSVSQVVQSYSPIANTDSCLASKTSSLPPEHIIFILYGFLSNAVVESWGNEKTVNDWLYKETKETNKNYKTLNW